MSPWCQDSKTSLCSVSGGPLIDGDGHGASARFRITGGCIR
jgi:hypothetical protein